MEGFIGEWADEYIARIRIAHANMTKAQFAEYMKQAGLAVQGTKAETLLQAEQYIHRIATTEVQVRSIIPVPRAITQRPPPGGWWARGRQAGRSV